MCSFVQVVCTLTCFVLARHAATAPKAVELVSACCCSGGTFGRFRTAVKFAFGGALVLA